MSIISQFNCSRVLKDEPVILELHFKSIKDEEISIGQVIILWEEALARKIGENLYEVYDTEPIDIKLPSLVDALKNGLACEDYLTRVEDYIPVSKLKFHRYHKGSKRIRPWESPKVYF